MTALKHLEITMQKFRKVILVGAGIAGLVAATAGAALAGDAMHEMTLRLPDGSVEHVRYLGDIRPDISFGGEGDVAFAPVFDDAFDASPFADIERISAAMEQQQAAMLRMATGAGGMTEADLGKLPQGVQEYRSVSFFSGNGNCTESVRYSSSGNGQPQVERTSSGSCGAGAGPHATATRAATPQRQMRSLPEGTIEAAYRVKPGTESAGTARQF